MLKKIDHTLLGTAYHTRLQSIFHFSIADYYKPGRTHFGCLKVINDDLIHVGSGHDLHKHKEIDVLCYVAYGELTHAVKGDVSKKLGSGDMYYLNAGSGIEHAEVNWGETLVRTLQFWFSPKVKNKQPTVSYASFKEEDYHNKWLCIGSGTDESAPFVMNQDVNVYLCQLDGTEHVTFNVETGHQAYLVQIMGNSIINEISLAEKDGLEVYEEALKVSAVSSSLYIMVVMRKVHN